MNGTGSGSCTVMSFGIAGINSVEPLGSTTTGKDIYVSGKLTKMASLVHLCMTFPFVF